MIRLRKKVHNFRISLLKRKVKFNSIKKARLYMYRQMKILYLNRNCIKLNSLNHHRQNLYQKLLQLRYRKLKFRIVLVFLIKRLTDNEYKKHQPNKKVLIYMINTFTQFQKKNFTQSSFTKMPFRNRQPNKN